MKVKGIKRGQIIELAEAIDIPDGTEIMIKIVVDSTESETLTSIIGTAQGSFATPEEADKFIRQERDTWDS
jgi:hypothetical protein